MLENLVRRHFHNKLTVYDASYVMIAMQHSRLLASLDGAMRLAAVAEGVNLYEPPAASDD